MAKSRDKLYFLYKTSVQNKNIAHQLTEHLNSIIKNGCWNFDLEDKDKVLRIISDNDVRPLVENLLINRMNLMCIELHYLPNEVI
ncbi:hypothetical protein [Aquimarina aquimarini]|uniref:hypothetical protein n=1 Tax=Aquimarina aquimarini TaxID=1191734 RepID=UPI000D55E179|nr:hypothetical protein [Aquimarina aquimarini]